MEASLVRFSKGEFNSPVIVERDKIKDYEAVVDATLIRMYDDAVHGGLEAIIPKIAPTPLKIEDLIRMGLVHVLESAGA